VARIIHVSFHVMASPTHVSDNCIVLVDIANGYIKVYQLNVDIVNVLGVHTCKYNVSCFLSCGVVVR